MSQTPIDVVERILKLRDEGLSYREIARLTLGSESKKSTVGDIINRNNPSLSEVFHDQDMKKVLLIDIETSPEVSYHWRRFKENISVDQNIEPSRVLGFAYKWYGEDTIHTVYPENYPPYLTDYSAEESIIEQVHELMSEANIVVGHNVDRFDDAVLKTRMLYYGITRPAPYGTIDTYKIAKREFKFPSNSLDGIAEYLGIVRKVSHEGFPMWRGCMEGDPESWDNMREYNVGDIVVLEAVFEKLVPWTPRLPNMSLYHANAIPRCPCCGSKNLQRHDKYAYTQVSVFNLYQCMECGAWARERVNVKTKDQRTNILTHVR